MKYTSATFTCPTNSNSISQKAWDKAFLTEAEFIAKYGKSACKKS